MGDSGRVEGDAKHIAVVIEMGRPFGHHHGCYKGILDYVREHHPDWRISADPYLAGLVENGGRNKYDGIVGRITEPVAELARRHAIPVVNHWLNSPVEGLPSVFTDYRASSRLVAEHFLSHGYRHLAMVSWPTDRARSLYHAGLDEAAKKQGVQVSAIEVPYEFEDSVQAFREFSHLVCELISGIEEPLGLFVPMDSMALYTMQICQQLGRRVPHDVGIAVFYNALDLCLNTHPTMTSVQANDEQVGYEAMRMLAHLMSHGPAKQPQTKLIPPRALRVRGSSEVFVSQDPVISLAMRYIAEHAREGITVEEVADVTGVSIRTLSRRFNQHVGRSVLNEINRVRVQAIKQALLDTEMPLQEVARVCGFTSTSHFNVFFRKATRHTPGAYRKKHRKKK